jgi:hypothetical protein
MSNVPFYETRTGRTYYESTMPSLVAELAKLNSLLAQIIDRLQDRDTEGPRKP